MRTPTIGLVALLLCACVGGPATPPARHPRETTTSPDVVAAESRRGGASPDSIPCDWELGVPIAEVTIDGRGPFRLMLDTGAGVLTLADRVADELALERVDVPQDGAARLTLNTGEGMVSVRHAVRVHELRAGPFVQRDVGGALIDMSGIERTTGTRIDGFLPASMIRSGLLTLDYERRSTTLTAGELPPADGRDVLELADEPVPFVTIEVEGRPCPFLIDSGDNGFLSLPAEREASLRFASPPVVVGRRETAAGTTVRREGRLAGTIAWGRHRIENPIVDLVSAGRGAVGSEFLGAFRTTFDFAHGRVRFERAGEEPVRSPSVRSVGAGFVRESGVWVVAYVLSDGPSARAGLKVGDRVESIDGRPAADVGYVAYWEMLELRDTLRLRVVGEGGVRDVVVEVATLVK